jgi:hypothetical protein
MWYRVSQTGQKIRLVLQYYLIRVL